MLDYLPRRSKSCRIPKWLVRLHNVYHHSRSSFSERMPHTAGKYTLTLINDYRFVFIVLLFFVIHLSFSFLNAAFSEFVSVNHEGLCSHCLTSLSQITPAVFGTIFSLKSLKCGTKNSGRLLVCSTIQENDNRALIIIDFSIRFREALYGTERFFAPFAAWSCKHLVRVTNSAGST